MKKSVLLLFVVCLFVATRFTAHAAVTTAQILKQMDDLQTLQEDVTAKVSIVQQDVDQGQRNMEAIFFAKNIQDLFLIVMTQPESEKGNGYLKNQDKFWMYRRNTRTFQIISRDESIGGSDANAGDFETPQYQKQYRAVLDAAGKESIRSETLGNIPVYRVEIVAKTSDVSYPKKILWVRQDHFLPLKEQNFAKSGTLMTTQYYLKYTQIKGRYIATQQMAIDEFEKGNKTVWQISNIQFAPLADSVFTKAYLENLSK
jgi:outer membrane lipoprotein-sorting protein